MITALNPHAILVPLTVAQAAEAIEMTPAHVYRLIKAGKIRAYKIKKPGKPAVLRVPVWAIMLWQDAELMRVLWGHIAPD